MWLGTDLVFEAFTFHIVETEYGVFQIHGYPYDETMSTFIVETDEETWRRAGLDAREAHPFAPGENDEESIAFCRELFADILGGHTLVANNSRWLNFNTVRNAHWCARATSCCSATRRTPRTSRSGRARSSRWRTPSPSRGRSATADDVRGALTAYEDERRPVVESTQRAAQASLEWFEGIARYVGQEPSVVRVQPAHAQPPHHVRQPAPARPRVRRERRRRLHPVRAGLQRPRADPADVPAVPPARSRAAQPRRRLADGHVHRGRRRRERLPSRPPRRARPWAAPRS